jgi:hypothetical protein
MSYFLKRLACRLLILAVLAFGVLGTSSESDTARACHEICQTVGGYAQCAYTSGYGNIGCTVDIVNNRCRFRLYCA